MKTVIYYFTTCNIVLNNSQTDQLVQLKLYEYLLCVMHEAKLSVSQCVDLNFLLKYCVWLHIYSVFTVRSYNAEGCLNYSIFVRLFVRLTPA